MCGILFSFSYQPESWSHSNNQATGYCEFWATTVSDILPFNEVSSLLFLCKRQYFMIFSPCVCVSQEVCSSSLCFVPDLCVTIVILSIIMFLQVVNSTLLLPNKKFLCPVALFLGKQKLPVSQLTHAVWQFPYTQDEYS